MKIVVQILGAALVGVVLAAPVRAQQPPVPVEEEQHGLLAQATITPDSARTVALRRVPGGQITKAEIEREANKLVYSFEIQVTGKSGIEEVLVDARTGAVVSVAHERPEDVAREAAQERQSPKNMREEEPGLLAQATIGPDSARAIARRRIPGGRIVKAEIEREHNTLVYSIILRVEGKEGVDEVLIDAKTGAIVSVEHENTEEKD